VSAEILEKLGKMHTDIKLTNERVKHVVADVEDHHDILYGNGREGLKIKVDRIETSQKVANKLWLMMIATGSAVVGWLGLK
jgi:uncharacterized membrane protein